MMIDLDTTEEIVERLPAFNETHQDNTKLNESIQFLSNVFELHQLYGENGVDAEYGVGSEIAAVREEREGGIEVEEEEKLNEIEGWANYEKEIRVLKLKLMEKNGECDKLGRKLFDITQEMKVKIDRMKQLEDNNEYRAQVIKLEEVIEEKERVIHDLKEKVRKNSINASEKTKLENIIMEKESEIKKVKEEMAEGEEDNRTKIEWLEKIIEENEKEMDYLKDDKVSLKTIIDDQKREITDLKESKVKCEDI